MSTGIENADQTIFYAPFMCEIMHYVRRNCQTTGHLDFFG